MGYMCNICGFMLNVISRTIFSSVYLFCVAAPFLYFYSFILPNAKNTYCF